jgi:hypothetical protein
MPIKDLLKRKEYQTWYQREIWYPKNRERRKQLVIANKARILGLVREYKIKKGCSDCGYNRHAEALDFDHIKDGKMFNISNMAGCGYSFETIRKEIRKCEVVCANCHRVRTKKRRVGEMGTLAIANRP